MCSIATNLVTSLEFIPIRCVTTLCHSGRTESLILGTLSKLDEFLVNPQVRTGSGTVPGTSRNNDSENREPTGDRSLNDPYSEVEFSVRQASTSADSDREETSHSIEFANTRGHWKAGSFRVNSFNVSQTSSWQ